MTWEYASILHDGPAPKATLDGLGADRWELVSILQGAQTKQLLYVFKRPIGGVPEQAIAETALEQPATNEAIEDKPLF